MHRMEDNMNTWKRQMAVVLGVVLSASLLWGCSGGSGSDKERSSAGDQKSQKAETSAEGSQAAGSGSEAGTRTAGGAGELSWPEADIQCIVTAGAGGGTDAVARAVTTPLEKELGKPVVVINNGSAGGMVGMEEIAAADPDGYTLGVFSNTDVANFVYGSDGCEFGLEDFTYIAGLNSTGDVLVMKKGSSYQTIDELIAYAKENPGAVTVALPSTIQNLSLSLMNQAMGIETTGVVYEGGNKVFADLVGGHIDAGILSAKFIAQADEQEMKILGLMLNERLETFPDTPTFMEQGYDISNPAVRMLVGPKDIPQELVEKIQDALKVCYEGEAREGLLTIGESPVLRTGEELDTFLQDDFAMREELLN